MLEQLVKNVKYIQGELGDTTVKEFEEYVKSNWIIQKKKWTVNIKDNSRNFGILAELKGDVSRQGQAVRHLQFEWHKDMIVVRMSWLNKQKIRVGWTVDFIEELLPDVLDKIDEQKFIAKMLTWKQKKRIF